MKPISCLVVEDEPNAMRLLQDYISKFPFLHLRASCFDAMDAMRVLKEQAADIIFLDINMPRVTGIELAAMLPKQQKIIFTTAYSEYALDSFDYQVVDYLLKPITFKRFVQAVQKLQLFLQHDDQELRAARAEEQFLFIKSGRQISKIDLSSIHYIEALREYVAIHTEKGKILAYKRMKDIAGVLPPQFVRIHNSYIVNMPQIQQADAGTVQVLGQRLPVSNGYRDTFRQKIESLLL